MRTVVKTYKFKLYQSKKNKYLDRDINAAINIKRMGMAQLKSA